MRYSVVIVASCLFGRSIRSVRACIYAFLRILGLRLRFKASSLRLGNLGFFRGGLLVGSVKLLVLLIWLYVQFLISVLNFRFVELVIERT